MECRIRKHDDFQFEVKVAYPLTRDRAQIDYHLDLFIFLPYQVGINAGTYSHEQFYDDLRTYTRFKTPDIPLGHLPRKDVPTSPLTRISVCVKDASQSGAWDTEKIIYELKMFAVIVRTQVRDRLRSLQKKGRHSANMASPPDMASCTEELIRDISLALSEFRAIGGRLRDEITPDDIRKAFAFADEYVSLQTEELLLKAAEAFRKFDSDNATVCASIGVLENAAVEETAHREASSYRRTIRHSTPRERADRLYRESLLKKYCANVLFLSVDKRKAQKRVQHVLFGLSAGLAMAVGLTGLWLAVRYFGHNIIAVGLAAVAIYMFRDRLKAIFQEYGLHMIPQWTHDRIGQLIERQNGRKVGATSELVRQVTLERVPPELREFTRYRYPLEEAVYQKSDSIIHYRKDVQMNTQSLYAVHERTHAIDDIFRMRVGEWLERMDNPVKEILAVDAETRHVVKTEGRRLYPARIIVRLASDIEAEPTIRAARLWLSRRGIERIERY